MNGSTGTAIDDLGGCIHAWYPLQQVHHLPEYLISMWTCCVEGLGRRIICVCMHVAEQIVCGLASYANGEGTRQECLVMSSSCWCIGAPLVHCNRDCTVASSIAIATRSWRPGHVVCSAYQRLTLKKLHMSRWPCPAADALLTATMQSPNTKRMSGAKWFIKWSVVGCWGTRPPQWRLCAPVSCTRIFWLASSDAEADGSACVPAAQPLTAI